jgi:MFS family permease
MNLVPPMADIEAETARATPKVKSAFGPSVVTALALGATLNPINSTMISTALVPIAIFFGASIAQASWLIACLYLTSAIAQPIMGRLADLFGPRRVYLISLLLVALAGMGGVMAPSLDFLLAVRVLLGIGTSGAYPSAMRIFRSEADKQGMPPPRMAMATLSLASFSTQAFGPALGGFITARFGWHAIFTVNVPLALVAALLALIWLPKDTPRAAGRGSLITEIDMPGVVLFAVALLSLMIFLMDAKRSLCWILPVSALFWVFFWRHSARCRKPFIDVRMLADNLPLTISLLRVGLIALIPYCVVYGLAQWLESGAGYTPGMAGLMTLPLSIAAGICSVLGARTKGVRVPFILVAASGLIGSIGLMCLHSGTPVWLIATAASCFGVTLGLSANPTQTVIFLQSPKAEMGVTAGLQRSFSYFGAIAAANLLAVIYGAHATDRSFHTLALVMAMASACLLLFILLDRTLPRGQIG